ncbi:hypothetical protein EIB75_10685 [Epilithonimonas vandammei]|uniref:DUF1320 domain-containing protein n=1 Tax=Epilithonimonas vandammei TaxID=2487072 RepID=A0A3G8Z9R9_9FLAO|nr:hypothetical protein [Epilithonimonas vandammei]AZI53893.1 hypothetical protein EIB75_00865 [Epilithonimonas vandammei]AZI55688.1 hypothetical protein EIB75_10685 [Epilithonimonas vandammei]
MAFLEIEDMETVIYGYQVEQIADGNEEAMPEAIDAAIDEVMGYLTPNDKKNWQDGRPLYDVDAIFSATAKARNALLLQITKTIAKFHFINLCNADILYDRAQKNYDRAVGKLKDLATGNLTIKSLPLLDTTIDNTADEPLPYRSGSRTKFNHE